MTTELLCTLCITTFDEVLDSLNVLIALITALATVITVIISYMALSYARKEYEAHKQKEESEALSSFNERYCTDEYIANVLNFLIDLSKCKELHGVETCLITENNPPSVNDKEMFMRFFEELQYAIEQKRLSKQIVYDMFAYYALEVDKMGEKFVEDYHHSSWIRFRRFVKEMKQVKNNHNI